MIRNVCTPIALIFASLLALSVVPQSSAEAESGVRGAHSVVLVHGAWADGSSWSRVIPLLEKAGLNVLAVQNPLT